MSVVAAVVAHQLVRRRVAGRYVLLTTWVIVRARCVRVVQVLAAVLQVGGIVLHLGDRERVEVAAWCRR